MKTSLAIAGLGLAAMSLTACGGDDGKTSAPATVASSATSGFTSVMPTSSTSSPSSSSGPTPSSGSTAATSPAPTSTSVSKSAATSVAPSPRTSSATATAVHATFRAPTPAEAQQMEGDPSMSNDTASRACRSGGPVLVANTQTTCGFARAVESAWKAQGTPAEGVIYVQSPKTGDTFGLRCHTVAGGSTCYTSKRGYVHFDQ